MTGKKIARAPTAEGIAESARQARRRALPPVEDWDPPDCGDIAMRIAADGRWFYEGSEITRPGMVRLFSTILRRDGERFVLVTPVEKVGIEVEDAPFVAVDVEREDGVVSFVTNVGDRVSAGEAHPIRIDRDGAHGAPRPYVHVRGGLEALIDRKSFYRMVEMAEERDGEIGLVSDGAWFRLGPAEER